MSSQKLTQPQIKQSTHQGNHSAGAGYKQTEVGVIPEDWEVKPLGELFAFQNGINADKSAYGKGIPFINVLEVITHSTITESRIPGKITLSPQAICAFSVQPGDVLFNRTSETQEEVGLASVYTGTQVVVFGGFVIRARPRGHHLETSFASYALRSAVVRSQIVARGQGAVRANIGQQELARVQVVLPNEIEQRAIAAALSDADALIDALEQLIAKKRAVKQGAMQELLRPKDGWEPINIGDIADPYQRWSFTGGPFGSNLKSSDYTDEGVRIIQLQNIGDGKFKDEYELYTSAKKADELLSCNIYPDEIILSKMGDPVARACIIPEIHDRYLMCSDGIRLAVDQKRFNTYFIYTLINAPGFRGSPIFQRRRSSPKR